MKLSEMNTEQLFDALGNVLPYVWNFVEDENIAKFLADRKPQIEAGVSAGKVGKKLVIDIAMTALKERRDDTCGIIGAIEGKTPKQVKDQMGFTTLGQVIGIITDLTGDKGLLQDVSGFFTQSGLSDSETQSGLSQA